MHRIGIAASKIAQGNLLCYNIFVIVLSFLFSLLVFFVGGSAIVVAFGLIHLVFAKWFPMNMEKQWIPILAFCMIALALMTGIFSLIAISRNLKFRK